MVRSLADQIRAEGRAESAVKIVQGLFAEGYDIAFIAKVTDLSIDAIKAHLKETSSS